MSGQQVFDISRNWRKFSLDTVDLNDPDSNTQDLTFLTLEKGEELDRLTLAISEEFTGDPLLNGSQFSPVALFIEPLAGDGTSQVGPVLLPLPTTDAANGNAALSLSYFGNTMPQGNVFADTPRDYKLRFTVDGPNLAAVVAGDPNGIVRFAAKQGTGNRGGYMVGDTGIIHDGNEDATYVITDVGFARGPVESTGVQGGGSGYAEGDLFHLDSPLADVNAQGVVDTVDESGAILTYHFTDAGSGFVAEGASRAVNSDTGTGTGAVLDILAVTGFLPTGAEVGDGGTGYSAGIKNTSAGGSQPGVGGGDLTVYCRPAYMRYAVVAVLSDDRHSNYQDAEVLLYEGQQLQWAALEGVDHFDVYFVEAQDNGSSDLTIGKVATLAGDATSHDVGYDDGDGLDLPDYTNTIPRMSMLNGGKLDVYAEVLSLL